MWQMPQPPSRLRTTNSTTACRTTLKDKLIKVYANVVSHDRCVVGGRRCHPQEPVSRHLQADRGTARGYPMCDIILVDDVTRARRRRSADGADSAETTRRFLRRGQPRFGPHGRYV